MANIEHVQIAKKGRNAVADWREQNPGQSLDLNGAYMSHARMPQVDLHGTDMRDADLMGAMLRRANLSGCHLNPSHLYRAVLMEADLSRSLLNGANLRGANLTDADLSGADLDRAVLSDAKLNGAKLTGVNLSRANLVGADFTGADLTDANLNGATLVRANLTNAQLGGADLYESVFTNADLSGADFSRSIVGYTAFQNCDLSVALGLDQVRHDAPSTIGIDTLCRSGGNISNEFLREAGVLEQVCAFQESLKQASPVSGDCFISCSTEDAPYARNLQIELRSRGVRSWLFPEDARGSALVERHSTSDQEEVERWVRAYDKLIVVFTEQALNSETIRNDIIRAQEQQQSLDQWCMLLVAPDGSISSSRNRLAQTLSSENLIFQLPENSRQSEEYAKDIARLAEALKQNEPAAAGVPKYDSSQL